MKTKIRNVIFDFGGVIVDLSIQASVEAFRTLGADIEGFLGRYGQQGIFRSLELGEITPEEFCRQLLPEVPREQVYESWNRMLVEVPLRRLQAIKALKKHYHISLLSNTNDIHWDFSLREHFLKQGYDPEEMFEHVFLSQKLHMAKPDREIFEEVLRQCGYVPEETLYVDDSEANCKAFAQLGVQTLTPAYPDEWMRTLCPTVASIGFFDGVHQGHRYLIEQVEKVAEERGLMPLLVTFGRHPREVLHKDYVPQLLTSTEEKLQLLKETGVERIEVLEFTRELSSLTAKEFMQRILAEKLGVRVLVMGYDHRFGCDGGTYEDYARWGEEVGIEVVKANELPEEHVSSSECRRKLQEGDVEKAADLLGHRYLLTGRVDKGHHVGHQLGFPTANIVTVEGKLVPGNGVYAVWVNLGNGERLKGMLNIGQRPTLDNGKDTSIEVNILGFSGDLYGKNIQLEFVRRMRDEQRFESLDALQEQLTQDRDAVLKVLSEDTL